MTPSERAKAGWETRRHREREIERLNLLLKMFFTNDDGSAHYKAGYSPSRHYTFSAPFVLYNMNTLGGIERFKTLEYLEMRVHWMIEKRNETAEV